MSFSWFGIGGARKDQQKQESSTSAPSTDDPFPTSASASTSSYSNSSAPPEETVQSMLSGMKLDPSTLHPFPGGQQGTVDYMFIDDVPFGTTPAPHPTGSFGPLPMRTNSDKLLYGTGTAYLIGLSSGGTYGFFKGLRNPNATNMKLRINSVLNSCTRFGPWAGNSMGVLSECCCRFLEWPVTWIPGVLIMPNKNDRSHDVDHD